LCKPFANPLWKTDSYSVNASGRVEIPALTRDVANEPLFEFENGKGKRGLMNKRIRTTSCTTNSSIEIATRAFASCVVMINIRIAHYKLALECVR